MFALLQPDTISYEENIKTDVLGNNVRMRLRIKNNKIVTYELYKT